MTVTAPRRRAGSRSSREAKQPPARPQTLGVALAWIEAHCVIPDGFRRGAPFRLYDWQLLFQGKHYLVRPDAEWVPTNPIRGTAFVHSRSGMVGPQKLGKDPMEASQICLEGAGPALFAGFAGPDEGYVCAEHGCRCGWEYAYDPGEPRGMRWPTPLIQITAFSEDATANTYDALRPMIELGPLADIIPRTSEEFIRLPGGGRIDIVTSEARSRLGQRVTFVSQGEAGLWTKRSGMLDVAHTQYRGLAGMGGRAVWHTNAWDPAQNSLAQREWKARVATTYIQYVQPPAGLRFTVREDRWRIYRAVYPEQVRREHGGHVDLDSIETEAVGMIAQGEAAQAARFFGNQAIPGAGNAFDPDLWAKRLLVDEAGKAAAHACPAGTPVTLGFDGSKSGDHTGLMATCVACGHQWRLGWWDPDEHGGEIPRDLVDEAVMVAFRDLKVVRFYVDPPYWREELAGWVATYGADRVMKWETWRNRPMGFACRQFAQAISDGALSHTDDPVLAEHIGNAQRVELNERDDKGAHLWRIGKASPDSSAHIDLAMAAILSWEARMDAIAAGALNQEPERSYTASDLDIYYGPEPDEQEGEDASEALGSPEEPDPD